jgi:glycerophosphoryl diester phosphodiesterase
VRGIWRVQPGGRGGATRGAGGWGGVAGLWPPRAGPRGLALARRRGLRTTVYTVNDAERMRELVELGVDGIFTDRPELLLALVRG